MPYKESESLSISTSRYVAEDISLKSALNLILSPLKLTYVIKDGTVLITTQAEKPEPPALDSRHPTVRPIRFEPPMETHEPMQSNISLTDRATLFFLRIIGVDTSLRTDLRADGSN